MFGIPTKRLFVYIAAGLVVLIVGAFGLLMLRSGSDGSGESIIIRAGEMTDADAETGGSMGEPGGSVAPKESATNTTQAPRIWVQVTGAVRRPGVYQMSADARAFQAIMEAGGFVDEADQQAVALAAQLSDGCRIDVPHAGDSAPGEVRKPVLSSAGITQDQAGTASGGSGPATGLVNLNSATVEELDTLPGIGPSLAQRIISYREAHGPFTSVDQLSEVSGIGPARLEQLRPLVGL